MQVDREAATGDERSEAGRHRRGDRAGVHARALLDPRHLPVAQDVADVGHRLGAERGEEPDRVDRLEPGSHVAEARDPRHCEQRPEGDQGACDHEHERFRPRSLHVRLTREERHRHPERTRVRMHW